ncbi:Protein HOL1 like protein [Verticillium longisporum]|nr:Protein HOL1 like protein [Verticillium longisporum]
MIGWTVFIGVIVAAVFLGPPFFWNEVSAGYAYLGPFIGALAGFAIAGALSDWSAKYMTRLNKGIYEPEFRIVLVLPMFVIGGIGLSLYIVDAYRDLAIEGFTSMIIFKNFFSFALTWTAYDWIIQGGVRTTMLSIASVQVVICAMSIPMYIYGKRVRAYYHKHDILYLTKKLAGR